jgi:hypothetical protein
MENEDKEITLQMVMDHLAKLRYDLEQKIDDGFGSVTRELQEFRAEFRESAKGMDDLDERVQDIEDESLPQRMRTVESEFGIAA